MISCLWQHEYLERPDQHFYLYYRGFPLTKPTSLKQSKSTFAYYATEHFRMSGVYWGLSALYLMGKLDDMDREEVITWVFSCQHENGGFGGSERHDPHMLYTLSALQILALYDQLDRVNADKIAECEFRSPLQLVGIESIVRLTTYSKDQNLN